MDRYGIALGVILGLTILIAVLPGNATDARLAAGGGGGPTVDETASGFDGTDAGGSVGVLTGDGSSGQTSVPLGSSASGTGGSGGSGTAGGSASGDTTGGAPAASGSTEVTFGTGPHCRSDGRQKGVTLYMPPCVQWAGGDNGGATAKGVSGDKITVVRWIGQVDPATRAILQGARLSDEPGKVTQIMDALRRYSNQHYQTYGREVVFVDYPASGPSENDEAMKRDAINIAAKNPFAVIEGDPAAAMPTVLFRDLAQRNILCMCSTTLSEEFYSELPPMLWSSLPSINLYAKHTAEYIGRRLAGKPARYAGDELNPTQGYRNKTRKFGLIYLEGIRKVDPEGRRGADVMLRELARYGVTIPASAQVGYVYDPGRNQQDVTALIAKMKNEGVTTIIPIWDPLYPILITKEATNQLYFPEWFMVGTGLSDTTTAGRLYDQSQWRHAFGVSPLWVTWQTVAKSTGAREYHHGAPGTPPGDEGVLINIYRSRIQTLFRGIHMAGPNLTNETWVQGSLTYPKTGGKPAAPLVYLTRQNPTEIKDFVEVFYAANASGPDERGTSGTGMVMKVDGGRRYDIGQWPQAEPRVFDLNGAIAVSDDPPGGGDPPHEQDGHTHRTRCLSCPT
jgi:hypothetical protein